jgi:hypothetical protein
MVLFYLSPFFCGYYFPGFLKNYFFAFWIPGLITSLGLSFASLSGPSSTSAGFLVALPWSVAFLLGATQECAKKIRFQFASVLPSVMIAMLFIIFLRALYGGFYQESYLPRLTERVKSGPFKGLRTTSVRRDIIERFQKTLRDTLPSKGKIVFSCFFPAGYLMTSLTPNHYFLYSNIELVEISPLTDFVVKLDDGIYQRIEIWPHYCEHLVERIGGNTGKVLKTEDSEIWIRTG